MVNYIFMGTFIVKMIYAEKHSFTISSIFGSKISYFAWTIRAVEVRVQRSHTTTFSKLNKNKTTTDSLLLGLPNNWRLKKIICVVLLCLSDSVYDTWMIRGIALTTRFQFCLVSVTQ